MATDHRHEAQRHRRRRGHRRRRRPAPRPTTRSPARSWTRSRQNGVLVFRGLHLDPESQVEFCRKLGDDRHVARPPPGTRHLPGHARRRRRTRSPTTCAAPSTGTSTAAPRRRRAPAEGDAAHRPTPSPRRAARPSSPAPTPPTTTSTDDEKERFAVAPGGAHARGVAAAGHARPDAGGAGRGGAGGRTTEHPLVWKHNSGRRSLVIGASDRRTSSAWSRDEGRKLLDDLLDRATAPERVYRHEWAVGDTVIWDNRGVLHRAVPYDRDVAARDAPHDLARRRADPVKIDWSVQSLMGR